MMDTFRSGELPSKPLYLFLNTVCLLVIVAIVVSLYRFDFRIAG